MRSRWMLMVGLLAVLGVLDAYAQAERLGRVRRAGVLLEQPEGDEGQEHAVGEGGEVMTNSTLIASEGTTVIECEDGQLIEMMEGAKIEVRREMATPEGGGPQEPILGVYVVQGVVSVDATGVRGATGTGVAIKSGLLRINGAQVRVEAQSEQGGRNALEKVTVERGNLTMELICRGNLVLPQRAVILDRIDSDKQVMTIRVVQGPIVYRRETREVGLRCDTGKVLVLSLAGIDIELRSRELLSDFMGELAPMVGPPPSPPGRGDEGGGRAGDTPTPVVSPSI